MTDRQDTDINGSTATPEVNDPAVAGASGDDGHPTASGNGNGAHSQAEAERAVRELIGDDDVKGAERVGAAEGTASFHGSSNGNGGGAWLKGRLVAAQARAVSKVAPPTLPPSPPPRNGPAWWPPFGSGS